MFLLDTNVVSGLRKGIPEVRQWIGAHIEDRKFLSVITLGEILSGARKKGRTDPAAGQSLERWLARLRDEFSNRILSIDEAIAIEWGAIQAGRTRGEADGLIAATAIVHGLAVVTRNVGDFADTGVTVVNPWDV